jgi:hypothetical protein
MTIHRSSRKTVRTQSEKSTTRSLAQAQADSRRALIDRGGKPIHVRLEADAVTAIDEIKTLMGFTYDREVIAYALLQTAKIERRASAYDRAKKVERLFG